MPSDRPREIPGFVRWVPRDTGTFHGPHHHNNREPECPRCGIFVPCERHAEVGEPEPEAGADYTPHHLR